MKSEAAKWVERVKDIKLYTKAGGGTNERYPYRSLFLLWLIGQIAQDDQQREASPVQVRFKECEKTLGELLAPHRVGKTTPKPEYPFVYLARHDKFWTVQDSNGKNVYEMPQARREKVTFLRSEVEGSVQPQFEQAMRDEYVRSRVVEQILDLGFPETQHDQVLEQTKLTDHVALVRTPRHPRFRKIVLHAYANRCCFCGFKTQLDNDPVGLEAAHVRMHSMGGPDQVSNGVALCVLHHRLFDRGALGIDSKHRILVSEHVHPVDGTPPNDIRSLVRRKIYLPVGANLPPAKEHLEWHYENLFKHDALRT